MHWQVQDAKKRFSELVRATKTEGAQFITRHGREEAVILSMEDYRRLAGAPSFKTLLREPPYLDDLPDTSDLRSELPREQDLGFDL
ncbi:type II toxin-antitoxin system Phd/YefM family antitoxin [Glycomyces sp. NPDC049804]|uniref:type II toxin-antitoxin system Phd/YefM family antitoxin n=1 Tax=Glycomyces sp. NPDC049804 TaxID=3154363 RepID=UPI00343D24D3